MLFRGCKEWNARADVMAEEKAETAQEISRTANELDVMLAGDCGKSKGVLVALRVDDGIIGG